VSYWTDLFTLTRFLFFRHSHSCYITIQNNNRCYNSVVIKVESTYVGYWEKELKPWVHYIPVEADFSDLEKTVRYVMDPQNAEQIQQVIKNSQAFCRTKLTMEQYTVDILWTLLAYRELIAGSPDFLDEWRSNEAAYSMPALDMKSWRSKAQAQATS
jgi:hypothetical protein